MKRLDTTGFRFSTVTGALALTLAAGALAGDRRPEFPISIAQARDRAEARFQTLDADGSGEISAAEFEAAAAAGHWPGRGVSGQGPHRRHPSGKWPADTREAPDAELFGSLDENGDGQLSKSEFTPDRLRQARRAASQTQVFSRLDRDGSGGLSRTELPDMNRWLEAMDTDGDGTVTRQEAREHRQQRSQERG